MDLNLQHKTALVCGSTQGIGRAAAQEIARLGAHVILLSRNEEKLRETLSSLDTSMGQSHKFLAADYSEPNQLKSKIDSLVKSNEPIHILVNNTGDLPAASSPMLKQKNF
ncbi:MAG: SDR family NAD(P)-dependent oxidoreductase [Bacteroidetes bacterium]|nr:SDR family NAD(P)-dependent oxidoreductase [Bacteroidota bacterium]